MKLKLERFQFTDKSTIGKLSADDKFICYTLEDKVRETDEPVDKWKVYGQTAIPRGIYTVIVDFSNRFQKNLPRLLNVPGFSGVRIHSGNTNEDTEGCILVGSNYSQDKVGNSRATFNLLMSAIENAYDLDEGIEIEII